MFWTLPCEACSPPWLMWCSHRLVALCFRIKLQKIGWEGEPQLRKKKYLVCFRRWLESQNAEEKDKKFLPSLRRANSQACQRRVGEKVSNMWRLSGLRQGRWHPERHACLRSHGEKPKRERERESGLLQKKHYFLFKTILIIIFPIMLLLFPCLKFNQSVTFDLCPTCPHAILLAFWSLKQ